MQSRGVSYCAVQERLKYSIVGSVERATRALAAKPAMCAAVPQETQGLTPPQPRRNDSSSLWVFCRQSPIATSDQLLRGVGRIQESQDYAGKDTQTVLFPECAIAPCPRTPGRIGITKTIVTNIRHIPMMNVGNTPRL